MTPPRALFAGEMLRFWRRERGLSQMTLALEANVSTRHLSCVETGRARGGRDLLLHLCRTLAVPGPEARRMLMAAGHAPPAAHDGVEPEEIPALQALATPMAPLPR